jgi:HTH-type transcriptional regulator/antitoxin HigA
MIMTNLQTAFCPDWVSPPGETITDIIEEKDWTQVELAERLGYTTKHLSLLINGKAALTEDAALKLERVLGSTANFWLNREAKYREHLARIDMQERNQKSITWLEQLPLNELKKIGVIPNERITAQAKPELVERLLRFFCVASPEQWQERYAGMQVAFRRTRETQSDVGAISSWLRLGEIEAEKLDTPHYNASEFKKALHRIRELTIQPPEIFEPEMRRLCHEAGVTFVMVPAIPKAHVSGVARWLNPHRPLIQLSLYGKTNDKFWFTFFHEAAHILLHADGKKAIYLDDLNADCQNPQEAEANQWAGNFLIPVTHHDKLSELQSKNTVVAFSKEIGVHAGIVVGRLQHDNIIQLSWMNDLKASFRCAESS